MCLFLNKLRPDCLWHIVDSDVGRKAELELEELPLWLRVGVVHGEGAEAGLPIAQVPNLPRTLFEWVR